MPTWLKSRYYLPFSPLSFYLTVDVSLQQRGGELEAVGGQGDQGEDQSKGVGHASQPMHPLWISLDEEYGFTF